MTRLLWEATYLDGRTPAARLATVRLTRQALVLRLDDGSEVVWPLGEVHQTQGFHAGEQVRLERGQGRHEALVLSDQGFLTSLRAVAPEAGRRFVDPVRRRRRGVLVGSSALGALGLLAVLYLVGIPAAAGFVADRVPAAWEARLGAAVVDQVAPPGQRCTDPAGRAALERIVDRLAGALGPTPYRFRVQVAREEVVNALAAPGGHLVVFRGLVGFAVSPEELAGVLAHEIQHVTRRHATRRLIEQAGLAVLLAAVTGDPTGAAAVGAEAARALAAARYSRAAEEEADREGLRLLVAAGVDPAGMVSLFDRLARTGGAEPTLLAFLSTHPRTEERVAALRALAAAAPATRAPLLTPAEWDALKRICG